MVGWIILGVIVLIIVGIMLIPVGADIAYEGGELRVSAKVAGMLLQLLPKQPGGEPKPKKEKKPKKKKKEKPPAEEPEQKEEKKGLPLGLNKEELLELVKKVFHGLGLFPKKLSVDRFLLHFTAAGEDPYNTALTYAYVNEALSILAPLARRSVRVRQTDVWTNVDFTADQAQFDFGLALSIRIGQIFGVVNTIAFGALGVVMGSKLRQKREARAEKAAMKKVETQSEHTEKETEAIQVEERMDANG